MRDPPDGEDKHADRRGRTERGDGDQRRRRRPSSSPNGGFWRRAPPSDQGAGRGSDTGSVRTSTTSLGAARRVYPGGLLRAVRILSGRRPSPVAAQSSRSSAGRSRSGDQRDRAALLPQRPDVVHLVPGHEDDHGVRALRRQDARRLDAVEAGHPDVEQDEVGPEVIGSAQRLRARRRLAGQDEAGRRRDQRPSGLAEDQLVVDGQHLHGASCRRDEDDRADRPVPLRVVSPVLRLAEEAGETPTRSHGPDLGAAPRTGPAPLRSPCPHAASTRLVHETLGADGDAVITCLVMPALAPGREQAVDGLGADDPAGSGDA